MGEREKEIVCVRDIRERERDREFWGGILGEREKERELV